MQGVGAYSLGPLSLLIYEGKVAYLSMVGKKQMENILSKDTSVSFEESIVLGGHLSLLKALRLSRHEHGTLITDLLSLAVKSGRPSLVKYLLKVYAKEFRDMDSGERLSGLYSNCLKELTENKKELSGLKELMDHLLDLCLLGNMIRESLNSIAFHGDVEFFKRLLSLFPYYASSYNIMLLEAIRGGSQEIARLLISKDKSLSSPLLNKPLDTAASYGHLEILKFLIENGAIPDKNTQYNANEKGHYRLAIYLSSLNPPALTVSAKAEEKEAYNGYIYEAIKAKDLAYLRQLEGDGRIPRSIDPARSLYSYPSFKILKFLVAIGIEIKFFNALVSYKSESLEMKRYNEMDELSRKERANKFYQSLYIKDMLIKI